VQLPLHLGLINSCFCFMRFRLPVRRLTVLAYTLTFENVDNIKLPKLSVIVKTVKSIKETLFSMTKI